MNVDEIKKIKAKQSVQQVCYISLIENCFELIFSKRESVWSLFTLYCLLGKKICLKVCIA